MTTPQPADARERVAAKPIVSDTPRTDAAQIAVDQIDCDKRMTWELLVVPADFARQLERENIFHSRHLRDDLDRIESHIRAAEESSDLHDWFTCRRRLHLAIDTLCALRRTMEDRY